MTGRSFRLLPDGRKHATADQAADRADQIPIGREATSSPVRDAKHAGFRHQPPGAVWSLLNGEAQSELADVVMARGEKGIRRGDIAQPVISLPERTDKIIDQCCVAPPLQHCEVGEIQMLLARAAEQPGRHLPQADGGADEWIVLVPPDGHRVHDTTGRGGDIDTVSLAEIEDRQEVVQRVHRASLRRT